MATTPGLRIGTPVRGLIPHTGKEITGFYRGTTRGGLHIIDGTPWDGDPAHMPHPQWLVADEPQKLEEKTVATTQPIDQVARDVLSGATTRDEAEKTLVRTKKVSRARAGELLDQALAAMKTIKREAAKAKRPAVADEPAPPEKPRVQEKAPPERFRELRDELAMTNKECAAASEAAGLGHTLSRMTELTSSKGATVAMFAQVEAAWRAWRAENPAVSS